MGEGLNPLQKKGDDILIEKEEIIQLKDLCKRYENQLNELLNELNEKELEYKRYSSNYKHVTRTKRLGLIFRQEMIESERKMKR